MRQAVSTIFFLAFFSFYSFSQDSTAVDTIIRTFEKVDIEASFPGGEQAWRKFLEKNLNPNVGVDNGAPCGMYTVYAQFIVSKEGRFPILKC